MILTLDKLAHDLTLQRISRCPPSVVLTCGCFQVLHPGHVRHLEAAAKMGAILCVLVTADKNVNKGSGRPAFPEDLRAEVVAALTCVDYATVNPWPTAVEAILLLKPDVYVKGGQYRGRLTPALEAEKAAAESVGGRLEFTDEITFSSTALLEGKKYVRPEDAYREASW